MDINRLKGEGLRLDSLFPFELDDFQKDAIAALNNNHSVVVCAPTGSGKTLIGEYAIYRALAHGKRVFYTTPLKALSNQKLRDFQAQFGSENAGLLTGDTSINRDAPILVMTTEIFRNMLYGTSIGQVGTSVDDVESVILDECHYMNDRQRGTVWEESIIYAPANTQLVALSATVKNSDQLTDWIQQVHGPTTLIYSDFRPVPLRFHFCNPDGFFRLLNPKETGINPRLKSRGRDHRGKQKTPSLSAVVSHLHKRDLLPAIYFIFSRKGCDKAINEIGAMSLVNPVEKADLKQQIDDFLARTPDGVREGHLQPLYRGIAAHHAGILPAWKSLVEELFQQGLIKVVFATETLAAGINMPARTTVISSLSKRTDRGHRLLTGSEFLQMAGRAGRRGMDEQGHVTMVQTRFEGASEAAYLATSGADPLISQFAPSYGMVLNLLQVYSLEEAQTLIERSFGQYLATLHLAPQQQAIADLEAEIEHQQMQLIHVEDFEVLADYEKLSGRLKEERRLLKTLQRQSQEVHASEIATAINFAISGTIIAIQGKRTNLPTPLPAVLVTKIAGADQTPYLITLGQNNCWYVVSNQDVVGLHPEIPRIAEVDDWSLPLGLRIRLGQRMEGDEQTMAIAHRIPNLPERSTLAPEVEAQLQRTQAVEQQLANHQAHQWGKPGQLLKRIRRIQRLEDEIGDRRTKLKQRSKHYWRQFLDLITVLRHLDCLDDVIPTPLGQMAAAVRGDNELWLGLALASGHLDLLEPHQIAAVCAALVTEVSRPDLWVAYEPSLAVSATLDELRGLRRQIFQLQRRYNIDAPVWLEYEFTGLIEQWALGTDWKTLCENTSLDEGDIVRILRRTLDFLSQVPHVPHLPEEFRSNARRASHLIDRFPVNESSVRLPTESDAGVVAISEQTELSQ
ncbi:MAG: DEAD/DEAH box helicase [Cyanothece sp. SIO2G6]|nr:DEAD/DEAH box helicase [Cyanothece sp. SIO2G6]